MPSTMNMLRSATFLLLLVAAHGFSLVPFRTSSSSSRLPLHVSITPSGEDRTEECRINTSPATVFGTPIDDDTKERNRNFVHTVKGVLFDVIFSGSGVDRAYARFYALETIARMPYFSYLSVLHLYETLGFWRKADYLKVHFAESW